MNNFTNPITNFIIFVGFITFFFFLENILPYDIYQVVCHLFATILLILFFYQLNKKNKDITLLNKTLKEKDELAKDLEKTNKILEIMATKDSLTGIGNRRYYFDLGDKVFALAKRDHTFLSLITIDIDDFKDINDRFGHQVGDEILKLVASNMKSELRKSDILARVGGEEFSIVLPNTNLDKGISIAEKIRANFKEIEYAHKDEKVTVSGSFGISQISKYDNDLDDIYARADKALYKAKSAGKNRVCYS